jgi:hypothetical protein
MDEADQTASRMEYETAALIATARARAVASTASFAVCRQCDELLPTERMACGFCSPECRDDFQKVAAADQRAGRTKHS